MDIHSSTVTQLKINFTLLLCSLSVCTLGFCEEADINLVRSAARISGEDYRASHLRLQTRYKSRVPEGVPEEVVKNKSQGDPELRVHLKSIESSYSAWNSQVPFDQLTFDSLPAVAHLSELQIIFERVREDRTWVWQEKPEFSRRIPWLYAEDGCYLRAELLVDRMKAWKYPIPNQIFVFGNLNFSNQYGEFNWWYHVAPIVRVDKDVFVIDPSLDFKKPLPLKDWILKVTDRLDSVQVAICGSGTLGPDEDCSLQSPALGAVTRESILQNFLALEWNFLEEFLGTPPVRPLGDFPPWKEGLLSFQFNRQLP